MQHTKLIIITSLLVLVLGGLFLPTARAQTATPVQCGTTVQGEFTKNAEDQNYTINVKPGYQVNVVGRAVGDSLRFQLSFFGPTWIPIVQQNNKDPVKNPSFKSGVLSARGDHRLIAFNRSDYEDGGVGVYTMQIECLDENGNIISTATAQTPTSQPSSVPSPAATSPAGAATATPSFSGVGFPGLPPVDFSDVARVPMRLGTPVNGAIGPRNSEVLGFTLNAKANETLELNYTRVSGNLNLGLVVLSADNKVFFQTSLVTSSALTTTLSLPTAGQYTIGVFRISLVEPTRPEATAFELQARLRGR